MPFDFWEIHEVFADVAKKYLRVPAKSAVVERMFSKWQYFIMQAH